MNIRINKSKSIIAMFAAACLFVVGLAALGLHVFLPNPQTDSSITESGTDSDSSLTPEPASETLSKNDASAKQKFIQDQTNSVANESPSDSAEPALSLDLSKNSTDVVVVTKITGISSGTCSLTASNGSETFTSKVDVIYQPSYSTCSGFSIPKNSLGPGTWHVVVSVVPVEGSKMEASEDIRI